MLNTIPLSYRRISYLIKQFNHAYQTLLFQHLKTHKYFYLKQKKNVVSLLLDHYLKGVLFTVLLKGHLTRLKDRRKCFRVLYNIDFWKITSCSSPAFIPTDDKRLTQHPNNCRCYWTIFSTNIIPDSNIWSVFFRPVFQKIISVLSLCLTSSTLH